MTDLMKENLIAEKEVSRKSFIKGGAAIAVGMSVAGSLLNGRAQAVTDYDNPNPAHRGTGVVGTSVNVDWWLQFNHDNTVTLYDNGTEVGNGTPTGAAGLAAEELNMTLAQVTLAPLDSYNGNGITAGRVGSNGTIGLSGAGAGGRAAGAAAKKLMTNMAATKWGVAASTLTVTWGVIKAPDGRKISYGDLMGGRIFGYPEVGGVAPDVKAANPTFTGTITSAGATPKNLIAPASYLPSAADPVKVVNQRLPRTTIPDMVTGKYTYNHNVRVPGMLHGRVVRPRGQGSSSQAPLVLNIDTNSVSHIPNVQVVRDGLGFVGVVAPKEYDAIQAAAQLKVTWDNTPKLGSMINGKFVGGSANWAKILRNNPLTGTEAAANFTAANAALAKSAATVSATFLAYHTQHAPFGPNVAIVDINAGNKAPGGTAWIYNQGGNPGVNANTNPGGSIAVAGGLPAGNPTPSAGNKAFRFISMPGSGTYGHSQYDDAGIAAAIMSKHVGAPVRVQLMRWDETGWDFTGPSFLLDVVAGVDANGRIAAYKTAVWAPTAGGGEPSTTAVAGAGANTGTGGGVLTNAVLAGSYTIPAGASTSRNMKTNQGYRESYLRAPGEPQGFFAGDQTADMLAYAIKMDPIAFRRLNLASGKASAQPLFEKLQEIMEWKPRVAATQLEKGNVVHGRGVSLGNAPGNGFVVGGVHVEVNKKSGKITVQKAFVVQDNGTSVNVASVENQISGCIVQGVSRALHENTQFSSSRQTSVDWVTYPILRFKDTPTVTTVTMPNISTIHGSGEPGVVPMPAAVANAFFDATGVRAFQYPMTAGYIRQILVNADKGITTAPFGMSSGTTLTSPGFQ